MQEFRDDDDGYLVWLSGHPDGFVINIRRSYNPVDARLHRASCRTIDGQNANVRALTGPYIKECADHAAELDEWAIDRVEQPILPCPICDPGPHRAPSASATRHALTPTDPKAVDDNMFHGPVGGPGVIEAWAEDYIHFERRPPWQEHLRTEIRDRLRQLEPSNSQVLHATLFGPKPANADVENLLLYNIDTFKTAGRNGIRFEHGDTAPQAPDGAEYRFGYRYALAPSTASFTDWQYGRLLATFDWTDLGTFTGEHKASQTWFALARAREHGAVEVFWPVLAPGTPFGVRIHIRPLKGRHPVWGGLVKGIVDGVICAFQAHTDTTVVTEVAARLSKVLAATPEEIEALLIDQRWAVLGVVPRLVSPYRQGVKWDPADHLCVAGELHADPTGSGWSISGEVFELTR